MDILVVTQSLFIWLNGEVKVLTNFTCSLGRYKALYLNEAGRMHAMSGEKSSAAKFYRLAGEAAVTKPKHNKHFREIDGQVLMLLASLNDQGLVNSVSIVNRLKIQLRYGF